MKLVLRKKEIFFSISPLFYWHSITNITWQNQTKSAFNFIQQQKRQREISTHDD